MEDIIYKYMLTGRETVLELPGYHQFLRAGEQEDILYVWVIHPKDALTKVKRKVVLHGTGQPLTTPPELHYVDTVFTNSGLVWHVFVECL